MITINVSPPTWILTATVGQTDPAEFLSKRDVSRLILISRLLNSMYVLVHVFNTLSSLAILLLGVFLSAQRNNWRNTIDVYELLQLNRYKILLRLSLRSTTNRELS